MTGPVEEPRGRHAELQPVLDADVDPAGDIAVVGIGVSLPGGPGLQAWWDTMLRGVDPVVDLDDAELRSRGVPERLLARPDLVRAVSEPPADSHAPDLQAPSLPGSGAVTTDPQHDMFLEVVRRALSDAGHAHEPDGGTALFASRGPARAHVLELLARPDAAELSWEELTPSGTEADHLTAHAAYRLGLTGPAVTVGATCAGSLVGVTAACESLADYRCDVAVAGGVHLTGPRHVASSGSLLSPDGRCRPFCAEAAGAGMASGAAAVVLRRLEDVRPDDRVYAVIRGHAVNNDGDRKAGFGVPSHAGQVAVISEAQGAADVLPDEVGLVEAHAMGTPWGDALELAALAEVWASASPRTRTVVHPTKAHVGNLDGASGVVALITAAMAIHSGRIPGHPHMQHPAADLDDADGRLVLSAEATCWPRGRRVAGVSAFGAGGTNAHVILVGPDDAPGGER